MGGGRSGGQSLVVERWGGREAGARFFERHDRIACLGVSL
jgi:hypothetical protein